MKRLARKEARRYASSLGADVSERLDVKSAQGPLGLLQLADEVRRRLRSRGGRPTMAEWDLRRPVPFSRASWRRLGEIGHEIGLSPAQLAALIVERTLPLYSPSRVDEVRRRLAAVAGSDTTESETVIDRLEMLAAIDIEKALELLSRVPDRKPHHPGDDLPRRPARRARPVR